MQALLRHDPGFDSHNVFTFAVNLPDSSYPTDEKGLQFEREFLGRLRALPGVIDAGAATGVPANGGSGSIRFLVEGRPKALGQEDESDILTVDPHYFSALKIPLIGGRPFATNDTKDAPPIAIVNQAFVTKYFPNENAVGKRVRFTYSAKQPYRQIVGVVGDIAHADLAAPPPPVIYCANDQDASTYLNYMVRTKGAPAAFVSSVRRALQAMDPQLPMINPQALEDVEQQSPSVFLRRYPSYLIGSFAGLALILAVVGLYGLVSYSITQRSREIGIRITLGAQRRDILSLALRQGLGTAIAGTVVGLAAGLGLTRLLTSLLFGITPGDWLTFAGMSLFMMLVALAACWIPARRATAVDPMVTLRHQ